MNAWKTYKLGEIVEYINGGSWPATAYSEDKNNIPVVRVTDIKNFTVDLTTCKYLKNKFRDKYIKHQVNTGDLVVCTVGSHPNQQSSVVGKTAVIPIKANGAFLNQNAVLLKAKEKIVSKSWLGAFSRSLAFKEHVEKTARGSANQVRLAISSLLEMDVLLPTLHEQKKIACILSSLDSKIELNHRVNQTLEQIAATLFKKYFVDDIDPDNLPDGWRWGKMNELFSHSKVSLNPGKFSDSIFSHYSIPAFDDGLRPSTDMGETILSNKFYVKSNSILFSKLNPRFPRIWAIGEINESISICSTEFLVFVPNEESFYSYCYLQLTQKNVIDDLISKASGTSGSHQRVRPEDILSLEAIVPTQDALIEFENIVRPFIKKKQQNIKEIQTLSNVRDSLLPKLMSGEIDLSAIHQNSQLHAEVLS